MLINKWFVISLVAVGTLFALVTQYKVNDMAYASTAKIELSSSAFQGGQTIPKQNTLDSGNLSPQLFWSKPPAQTKSIAIICDDPDAPRGTWVHWVIYNIPTGISQLDHGIKSQKELADGTKQGINSFGRIGYDGPSPPPGKPHRYFFKIYALDSKLNLESGATSQQLQEAMSGHVLAQGSLMGLYGR